METPNDLTDLTFGGKQSHRGGKPSNFHIQILPVWKFTHEAKNMSLVKKCKKGGLTLQLEGFAQK